MKKFVAVLLCLLPTALFMTSCGDAETSSGTSSASPSQTTTAATRSTAKSTVASTVRSTVVSPTTAVTTAQNVTMPIEYTLPKDGEVIAKVKFNEKMTDGLECDRMYLCSKTDFTLEGQTATAELYMDSVPDESELLRWRNSTNWGWTDGQRWTLLIRQGEDVYPLIDKRWVQLGHLEYYIWTDDDQENCPVRVTLIWATDNGTLIYEYDHRPQEEEFVVKKIYEAV